MGGVQGDGGACPCELGGDHSSEWRGEDPDESDLLNTADAAEASDLDLEELGETLEEAAVGSSEGSQ